MPVDEEKKLFVLKHNFTNVMNMKIGDKYAGPIEYHFRFPWTISIHRKEEHFYVHLNCLKPYVKSSYVIRAICKTRILTNIGLVVPNKEQCLRFTGLLGPLHASIFPVRNCPTDGNLKVEMRIEIQEIMGIKTNNLRNFDESMKKYSDVVLIVKNEKFYVLRKYLAAHSSYFESLFSENMDESGTLEIELKDTEPYDFQNFLEFLYGEPSIDFVTIDGIIHLSGMYHSITALRKCKENMIVNQTGYTCCTTFYSKDRIKEVDQLEISLQKKDEKTQFSYPEGNKWDDNFDDLMKKYSDVVLMVGDKKFLASHSPYFESLFWGNFDESGQSVIKLKGIDPWDFQNLLEILYGQPAINDTNVEQIIQLADMYGSKNAFEKCKVFISRKPEIFSKKKYELAIKYKLDDLKRWLDYVQEREKMLKNYEKKMDGLYTAIRNTKSVLGVPGTILRFYFRKLYK